MKPISVTMSAFGSYQKTTTIEFNIDQNIFLISGETGSGKTTLFDAITFALYGEGSGSVNKREGQTLQSRYSDYTDSPFVRFEFEEGNERYIVERSPNHRLKKKKGEGFTNKTGTVSLTMPDKTTYTNVAETNARIINLVGLTKAQFMQVAMIAQGDFLNIINEKTSSKKEAFRKLFNTEFYDRFVKELKLKSDDLSNQTKQIASECAGVVSGAYIPTTLENYAEVINMYEEIRSHNLASLDSFIENLSTIVKGFEAEKVTIDANLNEITKKNDALVAKKTEATTLIGFFKQLEQCKSSMASLLEQEEKMLANKSLADKISLALDVDTAFRFYDDSKKRLAETNIKYEEQKVILPGALKDLKNSQEVFNASEKKLSEETASFSVVEQEYKNTLEVLNTNKKLHEEELELNKTLTVNEAELSLRQKQLDDFDGELQKTREEQAKLIEDLKCQTEVSEEISSCKSHITSLDSIDETNNKMVAAKKEIAIKEDNYKVLIQAEDVAKENYDVAQRRLNNMRAGIIARDMLRPGCACPVCGNKEHPMPCKIDDEDALNIDIDALKGISESASSKVSSAAGELEAERKILATLEEEYSSKRSALIDAMKQGDFDITDETLPEALREILNARLEVLEIRSNDLSKKQERLSELTNLIATSDARHKALVDSVKEIDAKVVKIKERLNEIKTILENSKPKYSTKDEADKVYNDALNRKNEAEKIHISNSAALNSKNITVSEIKTRIVGYEASIPSLETSVNENKKKYEEELTKSKMTAEECHELTSKYDKAMLQEIIDEYNIYIQNKAAVKANYDTAIKNTEGKEMPDLAAIENEMTEVNTKYKEILDKASAIQSNLSNDKNIVESLISKKKENAELVTKSEKYTHLYNKFAGKTTGFRMDIETFVQRYYLRGILEAANRRYRDMTHDEFELRMVEDDKAGEGGNKGLDLISYSFVTGKSNAISSLSGGESFMAALALAIGMADQIALNSNVNLDMMFIDEGFGSLSKDSRDKAIRVLKDIADKDRIIGIISHVTELKLEIEDKLIVTRDNDGSHARWEQ